MSASPEDSALHVEGRLERRRGGRLFRPGGSWSNEWFLLSTEFLVSFTSRSSSQVQCCIPLKSVTLLEKGQGGRGAAQGAADRRCFTVRFTRHFGHAACDKTGLVCLRAPKEDDVDRWMQSIQKAQDIRKRTDHFIPRNILDDTMASQTAAQSQLEELQSRCAKLEETVATNRAEIEQLTVGLVEKAKEVEEQTARAEDALAKAAELGEVQQAYDRTKVELAEAKTLAQEEIETWRAKAEKSDAWRARAQERLDAMEVELATFIQEANDEAQLMASADELAAESEKLQQEAASARADLSAQAGWRPPAKMASLQTCFLAWRLHALREQNFLGSDASGPERSDLASAATAPEALKLQVLTSCLQRLQRRALRHTVHTWEDSTARPREACSNADKAPPNRGERSDSSSSSSRSSRALARALTRTCQRPLLASFATWQAKASISIALTASQPLGRSPAASTPPRDREIAWPGLLGQTSPVVASQCPSPEAKEDSEMQRSMSIDEPSTIDIPEKKVLSPSGVSSVACISDTLPTLLASPKSSAFGGGTAWSTAATAEDEVVDRAAQDERPQLAKREQTSYSIEQQQEVPEEGKGWQTNEHRWWKALAEVVAGGGSDTASSLGSRAHAADISSSQGNGSGGWFTSDLDSDGSEADLSFNVEDVPHPRQVMPAKLLEQGRSCHGGHDFAAGFTQPPHLLEAAAPPVQVPLRSPFGLRATADAGHQSNRRLARPSPAINVQATGLSQCPQRPEAVPQAKPSHCMLSVRGSLPPPPFLLAR